LPLGIFLPSLGGCGGLSAPRPDPEPESDCRTNGCESGFVCFEYLDETGWVCELDADGDGAASAVDCVDSDASIYPGATEVCDAIDQDCDGLPFTTECDSFFGPTYRVTILSGASNYLWDEGVAGVGDTAPDLYVEFGKNVGSFNAGNCVTPEVNDAVSATWNVHCDFTFEPGDAFKIELRDQDTASAELVMKFTWEDDARLLELLGASGPQTLVDEDNPESTLTYTVERLD
jgi:hypothetical protein